MAFRYRRPFHLWIVITNAVQTRPFDRRGGDVVLVVEKLSGGLRRTAVIPGFLLRWAGTRICQRVFKLFDMRDGSEIIPQTAAEYHTH